MGKGTPGPQGPQGPPGAPGTQGPQGPPGQVDHLQLQTALRADPQFRDNIKQALAEDPGLRNFITTYFNNNKTLFQGEKGITEFSALTSAQQAQVVALLVTNHLNVFVTELSNNATLRTALLNTMQTIAAFKGPKGDGYDHPDSANWLKQRTVWCADGELCTLPTGKRLQIQNAPLHLLNGHPIRSRNDGFRHILQSTTQNETLRFALEGDQNVQRFASFKDDGNWTGRYPISMDRNSGTVLNINHNTGEWAAWGLQPGQNEKLGVIFKNGPTRQDDGGPKTMTIRNDDGDLRLMGGKVIIPDNTPLQVGTSNTSGSIFRNDAQRTADGGPKTMTIRNSDGDLRLIGDKILINGNAVMNSGGLRYENGFGDGPYRIRFYNSNNACLDASRFEGDHHGWLQCDSNSPSQHFYYNPVTGHIRNVRNNKCLDQMGGRWQFIDCNTHQNQRFTRAHNLLHSVSAPNLCLDVGNADRRSNCDTNNRNQQLVFDPI